MLRFGNSKLIFSCSLSRPSPLSLMLRMKHPLYPHAGTLVSPLHAHPAAWGLMLRVPERPIILKGGEGTSFNIIPTILNNQGSDSECCPPPCERWYFLFCFPLGLFVAGSCLFSWFVCCRIVFVLLVCLLPDRVQRSPTPCNVSTGCWECCCAILAVVSARVRCCPRSRGIGLFPPTFLPPIEF
jgi:hypothetical protein